MNANRLLYTFFSFFLELVRERNRKRIAFIFFCFNKKTDFFPEISLFTSCWHFSEIEKKYKRLDHLRLIQMMNRMLYDLNLIGNLVKTIYELLWYLHESLAKNFIYRIQLSRRVEICWWHLNCSVTIFNCWVGPVAATIWSQEFPRHFLPIQFCEVLGQLLLRKEK